MRVPGRQTGPGEPELSPAGPYPVTHDKPLWNLFFSVFLKAVRQNPEIFFRT